MDHQPSNGLNAAAAYDLACRYNNLFQYNPTAAAVCAAAYGIFNNNNSNNQTNSSAQTPPPAPISSSNSNKSLFQNIASSVGSTSSNLTTSPTSSVSSLSNNSINIKNNNDLYNSQANAFKNLKPSNDQENKKIDEEMKDEDEEEEQRNKDEEELDEQIEDDIDHHQQRQDPEDDEDKLDKIDNHNNGHNSLYESVSDSSSVTGPIEPDDENLNECNEQLEDENEGVDQCEEDHEELAESAITKTNENQDEDNQQELDLSKKEDIQNKKKSRVRSSSSSSSIASSASSSSASSSSSSSTSTSSSSNNSSFKNKETNDDNNNNNNNGLNKIENLMNKNTELAINKYFNQINESKKQESIKNEHDQEVNDDLELCHPSKKQCLEQNINNSNNNNNNNNNNATCKNSSTNININNSNEIKMSESEFFMLRNDLINAVNRAIHVTLENFYNTKRPNNNTNNPAINLSTSSYSAFQPTKPEPTKSMPNFINHKPKPPVQNQIIHHRKIRVNEKSSKNSMLNRNPINHLNFNVNKLLDNKLSGAQMNNFNKDSLRDKRKSSLPPSSGPIVPLVQPNQNLSCSSSISSNSSVSSSSSASSTNSSSFKPLIKDNSQPCLSSLNGQKLTNNTNNHSTSSLLSLTTPNQVDSLNNTSAFTSAKPSINVQQSLGSSSSSVSSSSSSSSTSANKSQQSSSVSSAVNQFYSAAMSHLQQKQQNNSSQSSSTPNSNFSYSHLLNNGQINNNPSGSSMGFGANNSFHSHHHQLTAALGSNPQGSTNPSLFGHQAAAAAAHHHQILLAAAASAAAANAANPTSQNQNYLNMAAAAAANRLFTPYLLDHHTKSIPSSSSTQSANSTSISSSTSSSSTSSVNKPQSLPHQSSQTHHSHHHFGSSHLGFFHTPGKRRRTKVTDTRLSPRNAANLRNGSNAAALLGLQSQLAHHLSSEGQYGQSLNLNDTKGSRNQSPSHHSCNENDDQENYNDDDGDYHHQGQEDESISSGCNESNNNGGQLATMPNGYSGAGGVFSNDLLGSSVGMNDNGLEIASTSSNEYNGYQMTSTLSSLHLRKAKLMFFFTRYPSSTILRNFFPDVKFNKANTAQLVKWFSNFREFFYIQMEKHARQHLAEGIRHAEDLHVDVDSEIFRTLNSHYNRNNQLEIPASFCYVIEATLREFFKAIQEAKDMDPSWKKAIYKVIARMDDTIPEFFKSVKWMETLESTI